MRALVTGASGFIGQRLVRELLNKNYDVQIVTRKAKNSFPNNVKVFIADITDCKLNLESIVENCDIIFNCAGEINDESKMWELHIEATHRLFIAFANQNSTSIKHWVQLSSVGAYGPAAIANAPRVVTEETASNPLGQYEYTKTKADELIIDLAKEHDITYTILRPSNVVGATMRNQSFFSLTSLIQQGKFFYIQSKESIATYVHVDDVVNALILCSSHHNAKNEIFNLSNDCKLSEIVEAILVRVGKKDNFFCIPENLVRLVIKTASLFLKLPLTQKRVDSLVSKTTYPYTKIKAKLGYIPTQSIPQFAISNLIVSEQIPSKNLV